MKGGPGAEGFWDKPFRRKHGTVNWDFMYSDKSLSSLLTCTLIFVGGVPDPGAHRGGQTEDPGFSLIHHLPHAAGYT